MSMSRKHFVSLARELKDVKKEFPSASEGPGAFYNLGFRDGWKQSCVVVARACKEHNINFDWQRFMVACGCVE